MSLFTLVTQKAPVAKAMFLLSYKISTYHCPSVYIIKVLQAYLALDLVWLAFYIHLALFFVHA